MKRVLWPAVITLAITLLRLAGELRGGSALLFSTEAGGGAALIGISWLPPVFGILFGWSLARDGSAHDRPGRVAGACVLAILGYMAVGALAGALGVPDLGMVVVLGVAGLGATAFAYRAWPALGRVALLYALAARIPVAILMLIAIRGDWGTHYDVLPPEAPAELVAMGTLGRWFFIGLVPQMTFWVAYTVLLAMLFGALAVLVLKPKPAS